METYTLRASVGFILIGKNSQGRLKAEKPSQLGTAAGGELVVQIGKQQRQQQQQQQLDNRQHCQPRKTKDLPSYIQNGVVTSCANYRPSTEHFADFRFRYFRHSGSAHGDIFQLADSSVAAAAATAVSHFHSPPGDLTKGHVLRRASRG
ncbi:uncharacterized protein LOC118508845 [Anopheles stephensi]|uniref:uncharacterized protein LOC118508845 n=1 Tax=Anopheles stephensi TaxID=30069 RepID=UPI0016588746|nr:uncharacterized protein LOC118508845 [Anopheles stephensi]